MSDDPSHLRHELRTPVNHIVGYAELILEDGDVGEPLSEALTRLAAAGRESLSAITAIVDARPSPDGLPLHLVALEGHVWTMESHLQEARLAARAGDREDIEKIGAAITRLGELVSGVALERSVRASEATSGQASVDAAVVLVVDDDAANRDLLSRRVAGLGYRVVQASDGLQALSVMGSGGVDLVLLDIMMPGLDGYGVLEQRRGDPVLRDIPVIMISALDQMESVVRCIEAGAEDYLSKPFDPVLLKARAGACIERKRLRDKEKALLETLARWNQELEVRVAEKVAENERLAQLQRFLAPQLAEAILSGGGEQLRSHRTEITVLFSDLRGFTPFAETADPEDVTAVLREMHDAVGPLVFAHGGTLAQFTGDGMMVLFNDPIALEQPAHAAVRLGVEMRDCVVELADGWRRRGHELGMGVGIAIGHATCGPIGFEGRYEYSAIGTVCNLAARLCGEAASGQVLVSQRVATIVEDAFRCEAVGDLNLKGFARPVPTMQVVR